MDAQKLLDEKRHEHQQGVRCLAEAEGSGGAHAKQKLEEANRHFDRCDEITRALDSYDRARRLSEKVGASHDERIGQIGKDLERGRLNIGGDVDEPTHEQVKARHALILRQLAHGVSALTRAEQDLAAEKFPAEKLFYKLIAVGEKRMRTGELERMDAWEKRRTPAPPDDWRERGTDAFQNLAADADGGYTVPTLTESRILEKLALYGPMMREDLTDRYATPTGADLVIPVDVGSASAKATIVAEGAEIDTTKIAFDSRTLKAYKYVVARALTHELLQDTIANVEGHLVARFSSAFGRGINEHFTNGDGASKPKGITSGANVYEGPANNAFPGADDLIEAVYDIDSAYLVPGQVSWQMNRATKKAVRLLKSPGVGGDGYLWEPSFKAGEPDMLLGHPVYENEQLAAAVGGGVNFAVFGNTVLGYLTRRSGSMRMRRLEEVAALRDQVVVMGLDRWDGQLAVDEAFTVLKSKA